MRARDRVRGFFAGLEGSPRARFRFVAGLLAAFTVLLPPFVVVGPWLAETTTFGFHDWDVQTSHRYLAVLSILRYGELPAWNPYACGGFPAWSYVESGTIVVSPWLPFYLLADIRLALRIEVLGMALLGSLGTYLAASRFTASHGARALVVALFAVNGRWALQAASGHTWHLAYAIMPWALWAFERARAPEGRGRDLLMLGVTFAMLVYAGGIYPLPHTVLLVGLWAGALVVLERSLRPAFVLAMGGALGVGLSAPKLLPMLATFERAPRLIESTESLSLGALFTLLTSREQAFYDRPADVDPYGWHEWGMYVSLPGAVLLGLSVLLVRGKREAALTLIGVVFVLLGFGAFHPSAPWTLLHEHAPVFRSQHVPSRFLYPAVLVLGLVAAVGIGRLVDTASKRVMAADAVVASLVLALALDVASVAKKPMKDAMWMVAPSSIPHDQPFRHQKKPPFQYVRRDWAGPMYLAMLGNTGVLECYGTPPFEERGAVSHKDRRYRGEAFFQDEKHGTAKIVAWTPSSADIEVEGVTEDARLVYNMNFDAGWSATVDGLPEPVVSSGNRVALRVPAGAGHVHLAYTPPRLWAGIAVFGFTILSIGGYAFWRRRAAA